MKILILSCNTGEGHNSSAKAIKLAMDARGGIESEVKDTLSLVSADVSKNVSDIYIYSTRNSLFEKAYKIGRRVSDFDSSFKSPIYMANKLYAKQLYDYVISGGYDAVVCTHLFPAEALTALKRNADLKVPVLFVMTDYTCIPFLPETELDAYVIPHQDLIEEFVEKGLPREKLLPFGIPVDERRFLDRTDRRQARLELLSGLLANRPETPTDSATEAGSAPAVEPTAASGTANPDTSAPAVEPDIEGRWMLIMGGSMGFGNMGGLISCILEKCSERDRVICVCGRNEEQRSSLASRFADCPQFRAIGYTDQIPLLMDACDVLFSKPGGITSTEAAIRNIPLVHTAPIPGVEDRNALFFHYHNMSYSSKDPQQQALVAFRLCDDKQYRQRMTDAQARNSNTHCCEDIIDYLEIMTKKQ